MTRTRFCNIKPKNVTEKESGKRGIEGKIPSDRYEVQTVLHKLHVRPLHLKLGMWMLILSLQEERWRKVKILSLALLYLEDSRWLQKNKNANSSELHIMLSEIRAQVRMQCCDMCVPHPGPTWCWESSAGCGGCAAKVQCTVLSGCVGTSEEAQGYLPPGFPAWMSWDNQLQNDLILPWTVEIAKNQVSFKETGFYMHYSFNLTNVCNYMFHVSTYPQKKKKKTNLKGH